MPSIFDVVPRRFMAAQLRRPSGPFGRFVLAPKLNQTNAPLNRTVLAALDLGATDRVLEVGFGGGDLISRMLPLLPAAIAELRRIIAPGGRLVLGFAPRETLETLPVTAHGFCKYETEEVSAALRDAGFVDVTATKIDDARGADCLMVSHNPRVK